MAEDAILLADTLLKQDEILSELLSLTIKQREALREERLSDLQDLMSDLRHISVRAQAVEAKRMKAASDLAKRLGCEPIVSEIIKSLDDDKATILQSSARKLLDTVGKIKSEISILSRLMDEAKTLNEMMITEWRKLGEKSMLPGSIGTFDAKI